MAKQFWAALWLVGLVGLVGCSVFFAAVEAAVPQARQAAAAAFPELRSISSEGEIAAVRSVRHRAKDSHRVFHRSSRLGKVAGGPIDVEPATAIPADADADADADQGGAATVTSATTKSSPSLVTEPEAANKNKTVKDKEKEKEIGQENQQLKGEQTIEAKGEGGQKGDDTKASSGSSPIGARRPLAQACTAISDALPFLNASAETERLVEGRNGSCGIFLRPSLHPEEICDSRGTLWGCVKADYSGTDVVPDPAQVYCECTESLMCHGIGSILQPSRDVDELICRPDSTFGKCGCYGFDRCPDVKKGWACGLEENPKALPAHKAFPNRRDVSDMESMLLKRGVCECHRVPKYTTRWILEVTPEEAGRIRANPLQELEVEERKTAADFSIVKKKQGVDRVVIDIQKKKRHQEDYEEQQERQQHVSADANANANDTQAGNQTTEGTSKSAANDSKSKANNDDLVEHCVITDGWPRLEWRRLCALALLLSPMWIVVAWLAMLRYSNNNLMSSSPNPHTHSNPSLTNQASATSPTSESESAAAAAATQWRSDGEVSSYGYGLPQPVQKKRLSRSEDSSTGHVLVVLDPEVSTKPPRGAYFAIVALFMLSKVNLTVVVSSSHLLASGAGRQHQAADGVATDQVDEGSELGGMMSGALIAATPLGGFVGLFVISRWLMGAPRQVFIGSCILVGICGIGFIAALRVDSMALMMVLRFISGFSEGCTFLGQIYLARLSSDDVRTEVFAVCEFGLAIGLAMGPVVTSIFEFQDSLGVVGILAFSLGAYMMVLFPTNEELGSEILLEEEAILPCWRMDVDMNAQKWVAASVSWASSVSRPLLRLAWEGSAVMVLSAHYCLGYKITGYLVSGVIGMYLCSQSLFVRICGWMTDHKLIQHCEMLQLIGLFAMLRWPLDLVEAEEQDIRRASSVIWRVTVFVIASGMVYSGNCLMAAPMNAWSTKKGPRKNCVLMYNNLAVQLGMCFGAVSSRIFSGWDPHPNTVFITLLPIVLSHFCLSETGFSTMKKLTDPLPNSLRQGSSSSLGSAAS